MAKLLSYYNLCSISEQKNFLGVAQDINVGSIINTLGRNLFYTIQLNNQQQLNSWTVLDKLTNKVVYNFKTNNYVGVFIHRYIRCWNSSTKDINKIKKIKLAKNVAELISVENKDVIVVYTDGTCESLEQSISSRNSCKTIKPIVDETTETIVNASILTINNDEYLSYFIEAKTNVSLVFVKLNSETEIAGQPKRIEITRRERVNLVGYTIVAGDFLSSLITIWSDQRIFKLPIRDNATITNEIPGHFISMLNALRADQPLATIGISKDYIAIYGPNKNMEGASLILYNTQFSLIQSKQYFKVYFNDLRLWVLKKHIMLSFGQNLACVSFDISKEQLSDMIGMQYKPLQSNIIDTDCINEENILEEMIEFDCQKQQSELIRKKLRKRNSITNGQTEKNQANQQLVVGNALELIESFEKDLKESYRHNIPIEIRRNNMSDQIDLHLLSNVNCSGFDTEEVRLMTLILEKNGASEMEITDIIIPVLIAAKQSNELIECLKTYTNIADRRLADALKYFISLIRTDTASCQNVDNLSFINVVLSCSFNEQLIKEYLRIELTFDDVIFILNYIYDLLNSDDVTLHEIPQLGDEFNDDIKLLEWFCAILDAHFQKFLLSKNSQLPATVNRWKRLIDDHMESIRDTKWIMAVLYNLVKGKHDVTGRNTSKWYSIEGVKLY